MSDVDETGLPVADDQTTRIEPELDVDEDDIVSKEYVPEGELPEDEDEVVVTEYVPEGEGEGDDEVDCVKCLQACRPGGEAMASAMMGTTGIVVLVAAFLFSVFLTPLFDRGKSLFVASILCDESRPHRGMRWPTGLSATDYAWLLYHNIMSSIPFVNVGYAVGLTVYYREHTACLLGKAADASFDDNV